MKIAILGGSFDPPHSGHAILAKRLLKAFNFDEVWLMPCYRHPFAKNLAEPSDRFLMAKCLEDKTVRVSDFELRRKGTSYTIDTLSSLTKIFKGDQFSLIIGADQVKTFTKWRNFREILEKFEVLVIPRNGAKVVREKIGTILKLVNLNGKMKLIRKKDFPPINISSSDIRKKIKAKKSIARLVPEKVIDYINKHKLYKR